MPKPPNDPTWPELGNLVPRWRVGPLKWLSRATLRVFGWRICGTPPNVKKTIFAVAPHTSNWDWVLCMLLLFSLEIRVRWVAKSSMFSGVGGWFFRKLGGVGVDRSGPRGFVGATARWFVEQEQAWLALAPEGTRKKVNRFKSGFYHIAREADVPIVAVSVDFENRLVKFFPPVLATEEVEQGVVAFEKMLGFDRTADN